MSESVRDATLQDDARPTIFSPVNIVIMVAIFCLDIFFYQDYMEWLWGPYALHFLWAGYHPMVTFVGDMAILIGPSFLLVKIIIALFRNQAGQRLWIAALVIPLGAVFSLSVLLYGYYIHHIAGHFGVKNALEWYVGEVGFKSVDDIPKGVRDAFQLSYDMDRAGKAPWLPRAWTQVEWPTLERNQK